MVNFQLNEQGLNKSPVRRTNKKKTMAGRLVDWGLVSNEQQGNMLLIGFIILAFVAIFIINSRTFSTPDPSPFDDFEEVME